MKKSSKSYLVITCIIGLFFTVLMFVSKSKLDAMDVFANAYTSWAAMHFLVVRPMAFFGTTAFILGLIFQQNGFHLEVQRAKVWKALFAILFIGYVFIVATWRLDVITSSDLRMRIGLAFNSGIPFILIGAVCAMGFSDRN